MAQQAPATRPSVEKRFALGPWAMAIGLLLAWVLVSLSCYVMDKAWIRHSIQPAPKGIEGNTLWGGINKAGEAQPRIFFDNDCYYWIHYAREMVSTGTWRIRSTDVDNVPFGRQVHWDSGFAWLLVSAGWLFSWVTHENLMASIETASIWINPIIFLGVVTAFSLVVGRKWGGIAGALFAVSLVCFPSLEWDFGYGRPDHHGLHDTALLGQIFCLILGGGGWTREGKLSAGNGLWWMTTLPHARRWFIASGIFGGFGLWIGATQQALIIGATGAGGLLAALFFQTAKLKGATWRPELWRTWGRAGAATSLFFYCLEYFPGHMAMRLEVNHPLFALAWYCGGECLFRLSLWREKGNTFPRREKWLIALFVLGGLLLPACVALGPAEWHSLRDPYMRRMHDFIDEFQPLLKGRNGSFGFVSAVFERFGLFPLLVPIALAALWSRKIAIPERALVAVALPPAAILCAWTLYQARWSGLWDVSLITLALALVPAVRSFSEPWTPVSRRATFRILGVGALLLPSWIVFPHSLWITSQIPDSAPTKELARAISGRDVALTLKRLSALGEVRVMSGPGETPPLHFFGQVHGTSSLYWENVPGIHAAADFFCDTGDAEARRIVRERGITHVVVQESPDLIAQMFWVKYGRKGTDAELSQTLASRLASPVGEIPAWLEPVPFYGSPYARQFGMRIYLVLPDSL